ncbi:uncharacterized protein LOC111329682 isoform X1 [Stylophora pistillata]|uniref:uncharacterized protein LOC111329682 isoform X1 n=1 Tax=Stylophora pistillata TaxID=50429 RepID=UPI000C052C98|nr:uncharacterized protein LOC111329682 isoform X1 [Stylophora pistillata]
MWRSATICLLIRGYVLIAASPSNDIDIKNGNGKERKEKEVVRQKRAFGKVEPPCNLTHGVYLERWDRIDYKRIKFLLADPRYPNLPSFATCVPTFEQPANWGDFFGSRLRTYFVPLQTGNHYFYISSNAGSELYISTNDNPKTKTMITGVDGGFPTNHYEYDRFTNQKSLPVYLKKGVFYYMEAIMKDDHQWDHLEVALETPDSKFYKVIPSQFLWTINRASSAYNSTYQAILIKAAAIAGAKAGSSFGAKWAMKSGAKAGAKAGAMAGLRAGASAGASAGEKAAANTMTRTLEDAMNALHGDNVHKFKITLKNGSEVEITGPGIVGAGGGGGAGAAGAAAVGAAAAGGGAGGAGTAGATATAGAAGTAGTAGSAGTAGTAGTGGGAGGGAGGSSGGIIGTGSSGATGIGGGNAVAGGTGTGIGGGASAGGSVSTGGGVAIGGSSTGMATGGSSATGIASGGAIGGASAQSSYSSQRKVTYIPKPGEDPQTIARELVWRVGGASKLVNQGLYTIHSYDIPYAQENSTLNFCWRSKNSDVALSHFCQVFKAHIPGLYENVKDREGTVSFESLCLPGHYIKQRNYHFILHQRDGSKLFDKEGTFRAFSVMRYTRNLMLQSMHRDWYICEKKAKSIHLASELKLDFYNGDPDVLIRCTFVFHPIAQNENKYRMCQRVEGPVVHPEISGQPLPHPPHLVSNAPPSSSLPSCIPVCPAGQAGGASAGPGNFGPSIPSPPTSPGSPSVATAKRACVAVNFINNFGSEFKIVSSLKHEAYLVTGSGFKLKLMIDRPELHSHVTFNAEDPKWNRELLLNSKPNISEAVVEGCPDFVDVIVTSKQGVPTNGTGSHAAPPSPPLTPSSPASISPPPSPSTLPPAPSPAPPPYNYPKPPVSPATAPSPASPPASPPSSQGITPSSPPIPNGEQEPKALHYHYHYHGQKAPAIPSAVCPNMCSQSEECLPTCPSHCCKRDLDEEISDDNDEEDITLF